MKEILNRQAKHNYTIENTLVAGLILIGTEIKSVSKNEVDLSGSYVIVKEVPTMIGCYIKPWKSNKFSPEISPNRDRKLLLNANEVRWLKDEVKKGRVIIITRMFRAENGKIKVELGIGKPKKLFDKRETEKTKQHNREIKNI